MLSATDMIDRMLNPISQALTKDAAHRLVDLRTDPDLQAELARLAALANDGQLSSEQRADYELVLTVSTVVSILQAKARAALVTTSSAA